MNGFIRLEANSGRLVADFCNRLGPRKIQKKNMEEIEIREMSAAALGAIRARVVCAARNGRPLLFDVRHAHPSCLLFASSFVSMIREEAAAFQRARRVAIVAKDEWVRAALAAAMALSPPLAEHLVTSAYEEAREFCATS